MFSGERPGSVSEEDWAALKTRAQAAIEDTVFPAYREFLSFYEDEYAPNCRTGTPGILATPGGEDYYAYRVRSFTTTDMTPRYTPATHHGTVPEVGNSTLSCDTPAYNLLPPIPTSYGEFMGCDHRYLERLEF